MIIWATYLGLLAWAAISDFRSYSIPNRISLGLIALFGVPVLFGDPQIEPLMHLGTAAAVLAIGLIVYACSALGAGDVKLFAATSLWTGLDWLAEHTVVTALGGLAFMLVLLIFRMAASRLAVARNYDIPRLLQRGEGVPYGIAIATSAAALSFYYPPSLWVF